MAYRWLEDLAELQKGIPMKDYLKDFRRRQNNNQRHKKNCTCSGCMQISGSLSQSRNQQMPRAEKEALATNYRRGIPLNPVGAAPEKVGLLPRIAPQSLQPLNLVGMDHSGHWEPLPAKAGSSESELPGFPPALSKESKNEKRRFDGDAVAPRVLGKKRAVQTHLREQSWKVAGDGASASSGSSPRASSLSSLSVLSSLDRETPAELRAYLVVVTPVEEYVPVQTPPTPPPPPASSAKPRGKGSRAKRFLHLPKDAPKSVRQTASESVVQSQVRIQLQTNSEETLTQASKMLNSDDWKKKIEGLTSLRAVIQSHGETLKSKLHGTCLTVIQEVINLRSAVCMAAMATLGDMYVHLKRAMDNELEGTARVLLLKAGECNAFIRQAADLALGHMVHNCSPGHVMNALLLGGLSNRNVVVRTSTARHLEALADVLGPSRLLTGKRDLTGRFLVAVSQLAQDSGQEVRFHGRNMLKKIIVDNNFQKMWEKCIPQKEKESLMMVISNLRTRDLL
ncbi:TOG array regulator of axonemal microtubules protein 1-like [Osmerus eperlanus]|uniref:TOG array regulator of axonemal microtubules protein 1-like n=1 Tax=Osmerus eperlanus TaxID=29151 RepID=UPI002E114205